jgi:hypothetical protein
MYFARQMRRDAPSDAAYGGGSSILILDTGIFSYGSGDVFLFVSGSMMLT